MHRFYLGKTVQPSGKHEVHRDDCPALPAEDERIDLGEHKYFASAVFQAIKNHFSDSDECELCSGQ